MKPELYHVEPEPAGEGAPLPIEWSEAAMQAARNLGLDTSPAHLSAEHWQRVLASVEARMRLRGVQAPDGWREELATRFGRGEDGSGYDGPEI